jgi:putative hydrolase of the HAD superfamily
MSTGYSGGFSYVITDFGGVLTSSPLESLAVWNKQAGITFEDLGSAMTAAHAKTGYHPLVALEKGFISELEFTNLLEATLGRNRLDGFRDIYFQNLHPNNQMIRYLQGLAEQGFKLALLTNNVSEWESLWQEKIDPLKGSFETVVSSSAVGLRKPEPEIYQLLLDRLGNGVSAGECVFIDDLEANCDAAFAVGMQAVHFTDSKRAMQAIESILREGSA